MWINLKRFTLGAILLTSLSLVIQGCGSSSEPPSSYNLTSMTGKITDPVTNLPVSSGTVAAYNIDSSGVTAQIPLSENAAISSDGSYVLHIPKNIPISSRGVLVVASVPPAKLLARLAKLVFSSTSPNPTISGFVPINSLTKPAALNIVSDILVQMIQNSPNTKNPGFSAENIRQCTIVLEMFLGPNFTEVSLPTSTTSANTTKSQQDLLVSVKAIQMVLKNSGLTLTGLVKSITTTGLGSIADDLKRAVLTVTNDLINSGILPAEYIPNAAIIAAFSNAALPVPLPSLSDTQSPSAPTNLQVVTFNQRSVSLAWTASTDDTGVSGYFIYRAGALGVFAFIDTVSGATTYTDSTVTPGTSYTYKILAFDAARNLSDFDIETQPVIVTTSLLINPADTTPPSQPVGLVSKGFSDSQVNLHWGMSTKLNADGSVAPVSGYYVYRNSQIIATVSETDYIDKSVVPMTIYTYYVKAFDSNANVSLASIPLSIRTLAPKGSIPPAAPSNLVLASPDLYNNVSLKYKVSLSWSASTTQNVTYNVYRGLELIATGILINQYTDTTAVPGFAYLYTVTALSISGESTPSNQLQVQMPADPNPTAPPSVPQNFALASPATSNSVVLTWAASNKLAIGYEILRGDSSGNNTVVIGTVKNPGYADTSVTASTTYQYQVRSFSVTGTRSPLSASLIVKTAAPVDITDTTPPSAPTNLALVSAATSNAVMISWTASTKNTGDKVVAGYRIYRNGILIGDVVDVIYLDTTVAANTINTYTVKAYDNPGNISGQSNTLTVTTPQATPGFTIFGRVTFNNIGLPGVTLALIGAGTGGTITDANGYYSFTSVINGSYNISAARAYYMFTPSSLSCLVNNSNVTGLNFTADSSGIVTGGVDYPSGSITGGTVYPDGTIIGGITYPSGTVIGGITYPTSTVIGGVTYPTGTVIGGITYPNGVVIGGVSYPPGTVIGGIAFPPGTILAGMTYPTGTVIGGVTYPVGTVTSGVIYPSGTAIGSVTYPSGTVISGVTYPTGKVSGGVNFPTSSVTAGTAYPSGTIIGGIAYPSSTVIAGITYTTSTVVAGVTYPTGTVIGGTTYPNGIVIGGVSYPSGTVVGGVSFPPGTVVAGSTYPTGTVTGVTSYPTGAIVGGVTYPNSAVIAGVSYSTSTVIGGVTYPTGTVIGGTTYPNGVVIGGVSYPPGTVVGGVAFTSSSVIGTVNYPGGSATGSTTFPGGSATGSTTYPGGSTTGSTTYPGGSTTGSTTYPGGSTTGSTTYPGGSTTGSTTYPGASTTGSIIYPAGAIVGSVLYNY